jgi:hypothetical protein
MTWGASPRPERSDRGHLREVRLTRAPQGAHPRTAPRAPFAPPRPDLDRSDRSPEPPPRAHRGAAPASPSRRISRRNGPRRRLSASARLRAPRPDQPGNRGPFRWTPHEARPGARVVVDFEDRGWHQPTTRFRGHRGRSGSPLQEGVSRRRRSSVWDPFYVLRLTERSERRRPAEPVVTDTRARAGT